jgi:hypothetical protein
LRDKINAVQAIHHARRPDCSSLPDLIRQSMVSLASAWTTGSSPAVTRERAYG